MSLASLVARSARVNPAASALSAPDGEWTYGELDAAADRVAATLRELGIGPGERVALWTEKSGRSVAAMQGILRIGAVYVPLDPRGPVSRAVSILEDCAASAVVTTAERAPFVSSLAPVVLVDEDLPRRAEPTYPRVSWSDLRSASNFEAHESGDDDIAFILFTSGSTGKPKGVCISHSNALSFVVGLVKRVGLRPEDRLANHAPFHFDLSVFDLYASFFVGACMTIIPESGSSSPRQLVDHIRRATPTVWYSVPSALIQMLLHGKLEDCEEAQHLRVVLFAGEVFPAKHLAALRRVLPRARLFNLYGPTETNVCTMHEVCGDVGDEIPIGTAACGNEVWAETEDGREAEVGEIGELMVRGPTVMRGYWGTEPQGEVYATGDLVRRNDNGEFLFVARRDEMVKVRGFRVELGEVEAALVSHPSIEEAAVVVVGESFEAKLIAFVVGTGDAGVIALKSHCATRVPAYMVVHRVRRLAALPKTATGKTDRTALRAIEQTRHRETRRHFDQRAEMRSAP